ncbi:hypothetical protein [Thermomonospora cellulosilytica]|uniref:Uncharacterized protein n=1 Tax=Thermomonospora cellulosilytica TaxID=1411118 RepID=A0A7W3MW64_9ACTN|nr:hypothetical protein [Thermomonospora cellulosilytica]MBA9003024.1 hypothetical protein [Thermomonospora cellulosilytica]
MTVTNIPITGTPPEEPGGIRSCFVIGPHGDAFADPGTPERMVYEQALQVYENIAQAACLELGITPMRADELPSTGEIADQICRQVKESDLVIADLSGLNPNVIWELALRQGTGKPTIQLSECGTLPFYLAKVRTIRFSRSPHGLIKAREELRRTLEAGVRDGFDVLTPARILHGVVEVPAPVSAENEEESGLLDDFAQIESEAAAMVEDMAEVRSSIEAIGETTEAFTPDVERVAREELPMSARLAVILRYATAISGPADDLDASATRFIERMRATDSSIRNVLAYVKSMPHDARPEDTEGFLNTLIDLEESAEEGIAGLLELASAADSLKGLSRQLSKPLSKISSAVGRMVTATACISEWATIARSLLADLERTDPNI